MIASQQCEFEPEGVSYDSYSDCLRGEVHAKGGHAHDPVANRIQAGGLDVNRHRFIESPELHTMPNLTSPPFSACSPGDDRSW